MHTNYEVSSDAQLLLRLDKISEHMERNWRDYEFRSRQEMVDHYFWLMKKSGIGIILGAKYDNIGLMKVHTPEDVLKIFPLDEFRQSDIAEDGRQKGIL